MTKKAFTLPEVMITMGVIGVLAALLIPAITSLAPNKSKIMFKKAYYIAENTISELLNDNGLYPDDDPTKIGLQDTRTVTVNGITYGTATTKFGQLFASKVNLSSTPTVTANGYEFTTNDGIVWTLPTTPFGNGNTFQIITVDVVGGTTNTAAVKNPNCTYNASTCPKPDTFNIHIYNDGKLVVTDTKEIEYLGNTSIQ